MDIITIKDFKNDFILIPSFIISRYLTKATHTQMIVLLFILGNNATTANVKEIAEDLKITEEEFNLAVTFWVSEGVLVKNGANVSLFNVNGNKDSSINYDEETITYKKNNNKEFASLLSTAEKILNKGPFYKNEASFILNLMENIGLDSSVIVILLEYCTSINKKGYAYINKVAKTWEEEGITTYKLACDYVEKEKEKNKVVFDIVSIYRNPKANPITEKEKKNVEKWIYTYHYTEEIISKAYDTTLDTIGEFSPNYFSKIINNWYESGYKTIDDINNEKKPEYKKKIKKVKNEKTSYNVDENFKLSWNIVNSESEEK
ncbi:MAG: DnaD domain protein [Clostridia bacterium]